jgi:hypothetical protein
VVARELALLAGVSPHPLADEDVVAPHPLADEDVVARELALLDGVSLDVLYQVIPEGLIH